MQELGQGNINDSYLVTTPLESFVLQRINDYVFSEPEQVVTNMQTVCNHLNSKEKDPGRRWQNPSLLTADGKDSFYCDQDNQIWRCQSYIKNSYSCASISRPKQGYEVGWALGYFHQMLSDLAPHCLHETIPGFHVLPSYLISYDQLVPSASKIKSAEARYCSYFIEHHRKDAYLLENFKENGVLPIRVIHGDPKITNVLFDRQTDAAVSLIDLDTVGPGLLYYDLGDCLRSCCSSEEEGKQGGESIRFEIDICKEVLSGYFSMADLPVEQELRTLIYEAVKLITFELGLRFFSDYLIGNHYFKVNDPEENLVRSVNQFQLMESIIREERSIRLICKDLRENDRL